MISGFLLSGMVALGGLYWVAYGMHTFLEIPSSGAFLLFLAAAPFLQMQFPLFALLAWRLFRSQSVVRNPALLALLYTAIDLLLPKLLGITLGHALHAAPYLRQVAEVGGVASLTLLIVYVNLTFSDYLSSRSERSWRPLHVCCALAAIAGSSIFGAVRHAQIDFKFSSAKDVFRIAGIQANIGEEKKRSAEQGASDVRETILADYLSLTRAALRSSTPPDLIIWPEIAYPYPVLWFTIDGTNQFSHLEEIVRELRTPLLLGATVLDGRAAYNSALLVEPSGEGINRPQRYDKRVLFPISESTPALLESVRDILPRMGNLAPGGSPGLFHLRPTVSGERPVRFLPLICYEVLFGALSRPNDVGQADFIVNLTNDSWFDRWAEPRQHLAASIFRSIESGRPLVRVTNTGISALILPNGRVVSPLDVGERGAIEIAIPLFPESGGR